MRADLQLEVRACRSLDGECEWCGVRNAEVFSVYIGTPGTFACLLDSSTEADALHQAQHLGKAWGLPVFDRIERPEGETP